MIVNQHLRNLKRESVSYWHEPDEAPAAALRRRSHLQPALLTEAGFGASKPRTVKILAT